MEKEEGEKGQSRNSNWWWKRSLVSQDFYTTRKVRFATAEFTEAERTQ
jgi:hypothetical protein